MKKTAGPPAEEKSYKIIGPKILAQAHEVNDYIKKFHNSGYVSQEKVNEILGEFWNSVEGLGSDVSKIKSFNLTTAQATREVFRYQNAVMDQLKARKKEIEQWNAKMGMIGQDSEMMEEDFAGMGLEK
jgi:hypothetical protein